MSLTCICQYIILGSGYLNEFRKYNSKIQTFKEHRVTLFLIQGVRLGILVEGSSPPCFDSEIKAALAALTSIMCVILSVAFIGNL